MEQETQDILLRIGITGDKSVEELTKKNTELLTSFVKIQAEIDKTIQLNKDLKKSTGDHTEEIAANVGKIKELQNANKVNQTQINQNMTLIKAEIGSLSEKRAQLSVMTAAYTKMGETEAKTTEHGIALGLSIKKTSDELKAQEKQIGQTYRNVGDYTTSIIEAMQAQGLGGTMIGKSVVMYRDFAESTRDAEGSTHLFNGALKMLATNPIMLIIAVAAMLFIALKDAIGRNAEIVREFTVALMPLEKILGAIFGVIGDIVKGIVEAFAPALNEAQKKVVAMEEAERNLFNLRIQEKQQQEEINNLMAIASNRMIDGKAKHEALTKSIGLQVEMSNKLAENQKVVVEGQIVKMEEYYNLHGLLVNADYMLTDEANKKMSEDDKQKYVTMLNQWIEYNNKYSEIRRSTARKLGTIIKSEIANEKEQRDLAIALMPEGIKKEIAQIESDAKAKKDTRKAAKDSEDASNKANKEMDIKKVQQLHDANFEQQKKVYSNLSALRNEYERISALDKEHGDLYNPDTMRTKKQLDTMQAHYNNLLGIGKRYTIDLQHIKDTPNGNTDTKTDDLEDANVKKKEKEAKTVANKVRIDAEREVRDILTGILKDGEAKEQEILFNSYSDKFDDAKDNHAKQIALNKEFKANQKAIELKYSEEAQKDALDSALKEVSQRLSVIEKGSKDELNLKLQKLQIEEEKELEEAESKGEKTQFIIEKYQDLEKATKIQHQQEVNKLIIDGENKAHQQRLANLKLNNRLTLSSELTDAKTRLLLLKQLTGENDVDYLARKTKLELDVKAIQDKMHSDELKKVQLQESITKEIFSGLNSLGEIFAENQETLASFQKGLALFQVGIDTAMAISSLVKMSEANPTNAIDFGLSATLQFVTGIARIATNIAKAKQLIDGDSPKAPKTKAFSTGGNVYGSGTGTSDSINARLSHGESVNNALSTGMFAPIYSALNQMGGGVPIQSVNKSAEVYGENFLANAFMKAALSMPSPVVSVEEYARVANRVAVIESMAKQ